FPWPHPPPRGGGQGGAQDSSTTSAPGAFFLIDSIASRAERFCAYCWLLARMLPFAATMRNQNSPLFSLWWTVNLNAMACSVRRAPAPVPRGHRHRAPGERAVGRELRAKFPVGAPRRDREGSAHAQRLEVLEDPVHRGLDLREALLEVDLVAVPGVGEVD